MEEIQQGSAEWHALRLGVFTSSEIFKLMSTGKAKGADFSEIGMTYIMQKVAERLTGIPAAELFESEDMKWGKDNEDIARQYTAIRRGWEIMKTYFVKHPTLNYGGSGDGWAREVNAAVEIKCLKTHNHLKEVKAANSYEDFKKNLPVRFWQVISDAYLRGCDTIVFVWYDPRLIGDWSLVIREFKIDPADITFMLSRIELADAEFKKQIEFFTDKAA